MIVDWEILSTGSLVFLGGFAAVPSGYGGDSSCMCLGAISVTDGISSFLDIVFGLFEYKGTYGQLNLQ
ncbi:hypothetical protein ACLB2K_050064 [Fragaria x ananassa]